MITSPELTERHGFVRADCEACKNPDVWLTCNTCKKSDRFVREEKRVVCACGAVYDHAVCTCAKNVPGERLRWVAFDKGPAALAEWEIDKARVAVLAVAGLALIGGLVWWFA